MSDSEEDEKINASVYQPYIPLLVDKHRLRQLEDRYGKYFSDREQFDAFAMLPVGEEDRVKLLEVMITAFNAKEPLEIDPSK